MVYYGEGGFTFSDLYTMPVYLKRFYLSQLVEAKKKERTEVEKMKSKNKR